MLADAEKGKGKVKELLRGFWSARPYSKIVSWSRQYFNTYYYVAENDLEASGFIKYRKRNKNKGSPVTGTAYAD